MKRVKSLVRLFVINGASLYILQLILPAVRLSGGWRTYLAASVTLAVLNWVVRPVLELILLPINLLTLGMFRWVSMTVVFWLMTRFVHGLSISAFHFSGFSYAGVIIPATDLTMFWTTVVAAFLLTTVMTLIEWFVKK